MKFRKSTARATLSLATALSLLLAAGSTSAMADVGLLGKPMPSADAEQSSTDQAPSAAAWDGVTPQQPVFTNGEAQPVYNGHPLVKDEVWIPVPGVDTDRDGKDDQICATVYRPKDTDLGAA